MKEKLIEQYVNLYRILWNGNGGLWTEDLKRMSERELRKEIREMKQAIKEKNPYYPGLVEREMCLNCGKMYVVGGHCTC